MRKPYAYAYLKQYGGLDFLYKHWWALHTDNKMYALRDLYNVCYQNGGLRWGVYHGSYTKIDKIDLSLCEPHKDFGQGFYVTKIHNQAFVWATRKAKSLHTKGVITEFNFFESGNIVEKLVFDNNFSEMVATDLFYNSQTFKQLSDKTTQFYKKSWQALYNLLKKEIDLK